MTEIKMFQVDAFTDTLFSGNPAAVCMLDKCLSNDVMQSIAAENNLAETAFILARANDFEIRWFTPTTEVDLCGHATLAAAYVLFNCLNYQGQEIVFHSHKSGILKVFKENDLFFLDFPTDTIVGCNKMIPSIEKCIGVLPLEVYKGKTDYIAILENETFIKKIIPDFTVISNLDARGLIITSQGENVDFVSRFFAPQSGVNEDPVTGSAHTSLTPIWSKKLNKIELNAKQLSERGGTLICKYRSERCFIGGMAKLYLEGLIKINIK